MDSATKPLPPRDRFSPIEFVVVIGIAFGDSIFYSIVDVVTGNTLGMRPRNTALGEADTYALVIIELALLPILAAVLYLGGWRWKDFRLGANRWTTALGIALFTGVWLMDWAAVWAMKAMFPALYYAIEAWWSYQPDHPPGLLPILLVATVNPVFEEFFAGAYVIKSLRRRFGLTAAVWTSAVIRTTYHLYQGLTAAPLHFAQGLIHGFVYVRYGRLWPLILAHALSNFLADAFYLI